MAFSEARRFQPEVNKDWKNYNIQAVRLITLDCSLPRLIALEMKMEFALSLKFEQHEDLKQELLATGDAELVEVCVAVA